MCVQTIICRQLVAGHMVGSQPRKREKKKHQMITLNIIVFMDDTTVVGHVTGEEISWPVLLVTLRLCAELLNFKRLLKKCIHNTVFSLSLAQGYWTNP